MNFAISLENCKSYIDCQLKRLESPGRRKTVDRQPLVVTISRQAGAGGVTLGEKLAEHLQRREPQAGCRWAVFDRNLVETVLRDHHYSERIAGFMPERQRSAIQDAVEELLGLHPSSWTLVEKTSETILHLAEAGHAIIVGRGANVIIGFRPGAYHVRLVGSVEKRLENLQEYYQFSPRKAREYLQRTDRGRRWYLKKQFGKNIEDPLLYHLVLNMDAISIEQAAEIIGEAALRSQEGD